MRLAFGIEFVPIINRRHKRGTVGQLIQLLNAGISVKTILDLIPLRVDNETRKQGVPPTSSLPWIM